MAENEWADATKRPEQRQAALTSAVWQVLKMKDFERFDPAPVEGGRFAVGKHSRTGPRTQRLWARVEGTGARVYADVPHEGERLWPLVPEPPVTTDANLAIAVSDAVTALTFNE